MDDPQLLALAKIVGLDEGMEFVSDPGILSPKAFIEECLYVRFPNPYLGDTPQRIAVDTSQMVGIRFGENIKACKAKYGSAEKLTGITLAIAGWLRYLLAVDDTGTPFELSPDPMNSELTKQLEKIRIGSAADGNAAGGSAAGDSAAGDSAADDSAAGDSAADVAADAEAVAEALHPILSNANIFGIDLYEAGIGKNVEKNFLAMISGPGAVRKVLRQAFGE